MRNVSIKQVFLFFFNVRNVLKKIPILIGMQKAPKKLQDSKIASLKDSLQKANEKLKI